MASYILRRAAHAFAALVAVLVIVSVLLRLIPGDPIDAIMAGNPGITAQDKAALRKQLGLSDPLPVQVAHYLDDLAHGNLGQSLRFQTPVWPIIEGRLMPTFELTTFALIVAIAVAVPLGLLTALKRDQTADLVGSIVAVLGLSIPNFLLGILLILFFAVEWRIFPAAGRGDSLAGAAWHAVTTGSFAELKQSLRFLILPGVTLGVAVAAANARMIRSSMVEVLRQDFVRFAKAKGLPSRTVFLKHAFRNALIPVVTILGLQLGYLLSGAFVIENVFAWPGLGRLSVQALLWRDYPLVQGIVLVTAVIFLTINLLIDVLYVVIDPRIRLR